MQNTSKQEDIERIMANADDLLKRIDPELLQDMEDEQRLKVEQKAQNLKQLKSEAHKKLDEEGTSEDSSYSSGVHQAMDDIVKAMKALASYLS